MPEQTHLVMLNSFMCKTHCLFWEFDILGEFLLHQVNQYQENVLFHFPVYNLSQDKNRSLKVELFCALTILAQAFTEPYSEPNVIIYFERLRADCYAVSLLKRHTTLPESHVASNQR